LTTRSRNLLIIVSDEHRRDAMGCMGHSVVRTPNLDDLAGRGTLFEAAYCPSPICVPARAALATGQYVHRTGHWDSAAPYSGVPDSWMHALRDRGVTVVSFGKLHFRSADDDNGFTREVLPMHVMGKLGWTEGLLREEPPKYEATRELSQDVGSGETEYSRYDRAVAEAASEWLLSSSGFERPWAAFVSFVTPHYPLRAPEEFMRLYDPRTVPTPIGGYGARRPPHPELAHLATYFNYGDHFTPERAAEARAGYFALVSFMDDCVGKVLRALESSRQAQDTVVIYISDHGEMLGDHGFWTKSVMYEASVGVPMIVSGPGIPAGRRVSTPVTLLDIAATAAEMFDAASFQQTLPGSSLIHLAHAPDEPERTAFSEYHDGGSSTGSFMVRWGRWKYVYYAGKPPQLFDLRTDPDELNDLGSDPAPTCSAVRAEGSQRLRAVCNPDHVNRLAFEDQRRRIAELGGAEGCRRNAFGHTPAPIADGFSMTRPATGKER
jgi:choline-sulfatase